MQSVLQGVHAQGNVHPRAVGEEGSQRRLEKQTEDQHLVPVEQRDRRKEEVQIFRHVTVNRERRRNES